MPVAARCSSGRPLPSARRGGFHFQAIRCRGRRWTPTLIETALCPRWLVSKYVVHPEECPQDQGLIRLVLADLQVTDLVSITSFSLLDIRTYLLTFHGRPDGGRNPTPRLQPPRTNRRLFSHRKPALRGASALGARRLRPHPYPPLLPKVFKHPRDLLGDLIPLEHVGVDFLARQALPSGVAQRV
jgi:hypothetical protein